MKILIDGDGSPVKDTTIEIAQKFQVPVLLVTSFDHYTRKQFPENVEVVYVDQGNDAADFKIVSLMVPGDIVITQDYGLASLVLGKRGIALHQNGYEFTVNNIDSLLASRYESAQLRRSDRHYHSKGPKAYTKNLRQAFGQRLTDVIEREKQKES
ncbi:MAG: YaiI/YqxD family protein [Enterococcaceae bacterium]|nr:YaiI/YqxD family protein [Enterococcaceae bacterium]MCI1919419.1 YaiI/YqxD family protein [Enterococcaceae bacterium]